MEPQTMARNLLQLALKGARAVGSAVRAIRRPKFPPRAKSSEDRQTIEQWARPLRTTEAAKTLANLSPIGRDLQRAIDGQPLNSSQEAQLAAFIRAFGKDPNPEGKPGFQDAVDGLNRAFGHSGSGWNSEPPRAGGRGHGGQGHGGGGGNEDEPPPPDFSPLYPTPASSNVFSFQYRYSTSTLYVRFKAPVLNPEALKVRSGAGQLRNFRGALGRTVVGKSDAPGPLYAYFDVPVRVFERLVRAIPRSAGKAVWDDLRIRGTVYGHQYRYSLIEGSNHGGTLYVPRKATAGGFKHRSVAAAGTGRRAVAPSTLPEDVRPMRGRPDRGRMWQSRAYRGGGR